MLTIWKIKKNSRPFSDQERKWLINVLKAYSMTSDGEWLDEVEYEIGCEYYWCDIMNLDNGVLGARPLFGSDIYLAPPSTSYVNANRPEVIKDWIENIASVAIHELRHMWQQDRYGLLLWSILRLPEVFPPLYGKIFIERDAFGIEERAEEVIEQLKKDGRLNMEV